MTTSIERKFSLAPVSILGTGSAAGRGRTVRGYAALFNSRSANLGTEKAQFSEVIFPGAFDRVLKDDVRALLNHDPNLILARSKGGKGTLKIGTDQTGLWYQFESPPTQAGNDLLVSLKRGDIDGSSFAFVIESGGDEYVRQSDGSTLRKIKRIGRLHDVSPVTYPEYTDTTSGVRARDQHEPSTSVTSQLSTLRALVEFF